MQKQQMPKKFNVLNRLSYGKDKFTYFSNLGSHK